MAMGPWPTMDDADGGFMADGGGPKPYDDGSIADVDGSMADAGGFMVYADGSTPCGHGAMAYGDG